jgi:hypothetical protein
MSNTSDGKYISEIYYTFPQNGVKPDGTAHFDYSKKVAVKFLVLDGKRIVDPYRGLHGTGGSNQNTLYSKLSPDGSIDQDSRFGNPLNYIVVPANYDMSNAIKFAIRVNTDIAAASQISPALGQAVGSLVMTENFVSGGGQDLQRGAKWVFRPVR